MSPVGLERTISAGERPQTYALDRAATGTGKEDITFLFKISSIDIHEVYRRLRGRTVSEKLPKIPLFGLSLIHQLRLLGSQQHPKNGVLLTSFSAWATENSLAEINLESTGGDKGL